MQRLTNRIHAAQPAAAVAAAALGCYVISLPGGKEESAAANEAHIVEPAPRDARPKAQLITTRSSLQIGQKQWPKRQQSSLESAPVQKLMLLASSPVQSGPQTKLFNGEENVPRENMLECDYVVIGYGKAGQSAVRTIKRLDPAAEIAIIDPNDNYQNTAQRSNYLMRKQGSFVNKSAEVVRHLPTWASFIDHSRKLIRIYPVESPPSSSSSAANAPVGTIANAVRYRKSALVATGSRGAPPPEGCIGEDAWSRIVELRSTGLPAILPPGGLRTIRTYATAGQSESKPSDSTSSEQHPPAYISSMKPKPVLDPSAVRSLSMMAASQGATIAIMGSGFEAVELAASCARISTRASDSANEDAKRVKLLFGNSGPMSNCIPRYLGAAVTKRLRQFGIDVEDRAVTRYVSMEAPMTSHARAGGATPPRVELYTVKSYDNLDSRRILADLLVLAPNVDGLSGTAVIPTASQSPSSPTSHVDDHLPWSSLVSPPLLTCYRDDGRIATNPEFAAASSLYAAGSAARYPDPRTGRAEVAGGRHVHAEHSGEVAARNMVGGGGSVSRNRSRETAESRAPSYLQESIPVCRSDVIPYLSEAAGNRTVMDRPRPQMHSAPGTLALYSMGIHALCVGRCDPEGMATHGFWWTNTSRSITSIQSNGSDVGNNGHNNNSCSRKSMGPNAFMRRATRRTSATPGNSKASGRGSLPVYGSGVVFYLDRSGNVEGVMLWGLPYSEDPKDAHSDLNEALVERMKDVIRSNGASAIRDHSEKILNESSGTNIDVGLLSYLHLAEESKHLASMALAGASELSPSKVYHSHASRISVLGRPLHRYTPTKPVELTNLGKMHRKDESGHLAEEDDLFYSTRASDSETEESGRPPSLKRIYPMHGEPIGTAEYHELENELKRRQMRMERSRPPKEEPLWLRQGDEQRFVNRRDALAHSFQRNIMSGRFKDGSDAVRQAPVPRVYLDAKEKWSSWTEAEDEDKGEQKAEQP